MRVPVKVVVNGVIDSLFVLAAVCQVQGGDAQMIEKRREIGSRAQRFDAQISSLPQFLAHFLRILRGLRFGDLAQLSPLPDRRLRFWIFDVARHSINKLLQTMRAVHIQNAAVVAVGVDIDGGMLPQFIGMGLDPFGRAEQHGLFAIPRAVEDGAPRLPPLLQQPTQCARFFQQRNLG